ncbi:contactin-6 [Plakobranchus ocellatus]|uniref:Contactin-6 n=1 Tax=Plakobranchus ocellatus TaxID=259542 RepID=A0AAV4BVK1_9GAST|nr:contactin-6 [Plakobranchus ocellatus]
MAPATVQTAVTIELSLELKRKVAWFLERTLQSLSARAGEKVKLICGHSISHAVLQELPGSSLSWTFNTEPLEMDPSRFLYYKENLDITDLVPSDSGVYECLVTWGADDTVKQNLTLGVFSLEVETDTPTRYVFENEATKMDCHSVTLGNLFPDAVRYWLYNGTHTSVLPVTRASNKTYDVIAAVSRSMSGVWECQVMQPRTERIWVPAWWVGLYVLRSYTVF